VNWPEQALRNFTWIYKQKGFPWLKDSGSADAEVAAISHVAAIS